MNGLDKAQRKYDRLLPEDLDAECEDNWSPMSLPHPTDAQVEEFIAGIAETGTMEDDLGKTVQVSAINYEIARQWVKDKGALPGNIGPEFWKWARVHARLALFGK